jgi:peptidoglycan-associated lipoprotein
LFILAAVHHETEQTMKIAKILVFTLASALVTFSASAQSELYDEAMKAYDSQLYNEAIVQMKKAYAKEKDKSKKAEIIFKTAECYRFTNDSKQAETWYRKALQVKYPEPKIQLYFADAMKANGKFDEAIAEYEKYAEQAPSDPRGKAGAEACAQAQKWVESPSRYVVENEVQLNGKFMDFAATYASDGFKEVLFTSSRENGAGKDLDGWTGQGFTDLYSATIDNKGKWSKPKALAATINSIYNEGAAVLTSDFTEMYFTRCSVEKKEKMGCDIYVSKKSGDSYGEASIVPFFKPDGWTPSAKASDSKEKKDDKAKAGDAAAAPSAADSTVYKTGHPAISKDGKVLVFVSDAPGGKGQRDLWMSKFDEEKKRWGKPTNLSALNTPGNEMYPFIHADGTIYFASDGHVGMGGLDIFMAEKQGDFWGNVTNMRSPINSAGDDFAIVFEKEEEKGYFTSNREGGKGSDDIYRFLLPALKFTLSGTVRDFKTKKPIADATVSIVGTDGASFEAKTDKNGFYKVDLAPATSYVVTAGKKDDYLNKTGKTTTVGFEEDKDLVHDFELDPIDKVIDLPNIFYDLAKWELRPESKVALDGLIETLNNNPTIVIELGSHTDIRSSDSYNLALSQKRAQSVVDYLIENGIEAERLVAKGYGETVPKVVDKDFLFFKKGDVITEAFINKLATEEDKETAHQQNRRTEFKVLRTDFVPKAGN